MKIRIFNTRDLTVSKPIEVTLEDIKIFDAYCFDSDYKWVRDEHAEMSQGEVMEFISDAYEFAHES